MVKNLILTAYSGRFGVPAWEEVKRWTDSKAGRFTRPCLSRFIVRGSEYNHVESVSFQQNPSKQIDIKMTQKKEQKLTRGSSLDSWIFHII